MPISSTENESWRKGQRGGEHSDLVESWTIVCVCVFIHLCVPGVEVGGPHRGKLKEQTGTRACFRQLDICL